MSKKKEEPKVVEDFTDVVEETTSIVRENYIKSFQLPISLWEENLKFLNAQMEQWLSFQQSYMNSLVGFYDKFPGGDANSVNIDSYFKYPLALQESYIDSVRATLDSFTKQNVELIHKHIEKASSLFDSYCDLFRVKK